MRAASSAQTGPGAEDASSAGFAGSSGATNATTFRRDGLTDVTLLQDDGSFKVFSAFCTEEQKRIVYKEAKANVYPKLLPQVAPPLA